MRLRVGGYARQHDFDRDRAIEQRVMRAIDRAHAALAEQLAERVFAKCLRQCALRGGLCDNACWQYTMGAFSAAVGCWVTRVTWSPAAGRFGGLQTSRNGSFSPVQATLSPCTGETRRSSGAACRPQTPTA